uniref:Phosphatidate cytidylyltransferase n=1 Tax=Piliocolobus tephrosceles TaxID=591936 RepID=A0A8C9LVG7_9PRIM
MKQLKEYTNTKKNISFHKLSYLYKLCTTNNKNILNINKHKSSISNHQNTNSINVNNTNLNENSSSNINTNINNTSKLQAFKIRLYWGIILFFFSVLILLLGHLYLSLLVLILVTLVYNEIVSIKSSENKDKKLPQLFYIRWYWFFLTILTIGIPWAIPKLQQHKFFIFKYILKYHSINMFVLFIIGYIWFILSLRKYTLKYQFSQMGIILLTSLFVVTQYLMHIANIYSGLIWFFIPVSCVVINDTFAYIVGILFGRTKLINVSPNKTVEGFVGSSIITILWGLFATYVLQNYKFFICPQNNITFIPFYTLIHTDCEYSSIFEKQVYKVPIKLAVLLRFNKIYYTKMVIHGFVLSLFAAFLAPFGGFFASGFKRALKIKDFGTIIPGHGGVTDRLDCQIFIGMFTYIYMKTFVKVKNKVKYQYDLVIDSIQKMDSKEVLCLFNQLKTIIENKKEISKVEEQKT